MGQQRDFASLITVLIDLVSSHHNSSLLPFLHLSLLHSGWVMGTFPSCVTSSGHKATTLPQPCLPNMLHKVQLCGFSREQENTKIFCGSRNINFPSQGALDMGFGLYISKWKQNLNLSRILEQGKGAQRCLKILKEIILALSSELRARVCLEILPAVSSSCHSNNITDEGLLSLAWCRSHFPPSKT